MMNYNQAVMSSRREPPDSLDHFPTPPWGTRALMKYVMPKMPGRRESVWEPACGEGHMAVPLSEHFAHTFASDVHDYGFRFGIGSFVGQGSDVIDWPLGGKPDWVITNPPFTLAEEFVRRALTMATSGVAMLARSVFIESETRYPLFSSGAFKAFCPFASRLPMVKGQYDPKASSATSYAWFIWQPTMRSGDPLTIIIPPEAKAQCTRPDDTTRFAGPERCGIAGLTKKKDETDADWRHRVAAATGPMGQQAG